MVVIGWKTLKFLFEMPVLRENNKCCTVNKRSCGRPPVASFFFSFFLWQFYALPAWLGPIHQTHISMPPTESASACLWCVLHVWQTAYTESHRASEPNKVEYGVWSGWTGAQGVGGGGGDCRRFLAIFIHAYIMEHEQNIINTSAEF